MTARGLSMAHRYVLLGSHNIWNRGATIYSQAAHAWHKGAAKGPARAEVQLARDMHGHQRCHEGMGTISSFGKRSQGS